MRIMRSSVVIVFLVTLIVFCGVSVVKNAKTDDTIPEIIIENDFIEASCNATDEELLKGVTATDGKDGDLTSEIIVESISRFVKPGVCEVIYAVCDSDNHVAHAKRMLGYTDYIAPRFKLTESLCFSLYENVNLNSYIGAVDKIEGDISGNVVITSPDYTSSVTGVFTLELTVTNKKGDTSTLSLPMIIEERNLSAPKIELKEYLVYVEEGQTINFKDYIVKATSKNDEDLTSLVRIDDNVNFKKSGTYIVNYFVTDKNGAQGHSVLYIVVE